MRKGSKGVATPSEIPIPTYCGSHEHNALYCSPADLAANSTHGAGSSDPKYSYFCCTIGCTGVGVGRIGAICNAHGRSSCRSILAALAHLPAIVVAHVLFRTFGRFHDSTVVATPAREVAAAGWTTDCERVQLWNCHVRSGSFSVGQARLQQVRVAQRVDLTSEQMLCESQAASANH